MLPLPRSVLAFPALALALFLTGLASAGNLLEGNGFTYQIEDGSLVAWKDADFPEGLFGKPVAIEGDAVKSPAKIVTGIHVGAYSFHDAGTPSWTDDIEVTTSFKASDTPHVIEIEIRGRNLTKRRLSFREHPLTVWVGPFGDADAGRYSMMTYMGFDGQSVTSLSVGSEVAEKTRWVSVSDRYHATALELVEGPGRFRLESLPAKEIHEDPKTPGKAFTTTVLALQPLQELQIEEEFLVRMRLFTGLKREDTLRAAGYGPLFDTWSGMTGWISYLVFLLLAWLHETTQSWGVAIILMTVFVKIVLHPLSRKQLESMARMQELQPRMQALQARYQDNPQRMNAEVQKLWSEAGVNPLSGCLPLIMQLPIFIALYNCLSYAPELRGVPFLWLPDLSHPDPYWVLPFLFAFGIYLSSMQSATDPNQKTMMQLMPLIMFWFMIGIPAGVMIYLAGQTLLSFVEQRLNKDLRDKLQKKTPSAPAEAGGEPAASEPEERTIDNEDAAARRANSGNKYKKSRKGRKGN